MIIGAYHKYSSGGAGYEKIKERKTRLGLVDVSTKETRGAKDIEY